MSSHQLGNVVAISLTGTASGIVVIITCTVVILLMSWFSFKKGKSRKHNNSENPIYEDIPDHTVAEIKVDPNVCYSQGPQVQSWPINNAVYAEVSEVQKISAIKMNPNDSYTL